LASWLRCNRCGLNVYVQHSRPATMGSAKLNAKAIESIATLQLIYGLLQTAARFEIFTYFKSCTTTTI
jgi:hypothetical protein